MSIDSFFHKKYDRDHYNCAHFVCDVWRHETGEDINHALECFLRPPKDRVADPSLRNRFQKLSEPESPCLVVMHRRNSPPHAGIYLRGRVFHIHEDGVQFQPVDVASRGFDRVGFYK